jgi:hypothetical protein
LGIRLGIGALQGLTKVVLFAGPAAARPAKPEPITPSSASTYERRCGVAPRNLKAGRGGRRETPSRSEKPGAHRGEKPRRLSKRTLRNSEPKRRPPKSDAHGPATGRKPSKAPIRRTDPTRLVSNSAVQDICARNRWECGSGGAGGGGGKQGRSRRSRAAVRDVICKAAVPRNHCATTQPPNSDTAITPVGIFAQSVRLICAHGERNWREVDAEIVALPSAAWSPRFRGGRARGSPPLPPLPSPPGSLGGGRVQTGGQRGAACH